MEAVVAIGPIARLVPIDIHTSTAHRPIEAQDDPTLPKILGDRKRTAVPAHPDEGEATRTACVLHGLLLPILCDG